MKNIEKQSNTDNDSIYVYNYCKLLKFTQFKIFIKYISWQLFFQIFTENLHFRNYIIGNNS